MAWDKNSWNRYLRNARSALVKRDALSGTDMAKYPADGQRDAERERRAWAAKARANLKQLARLAEVAPDRPRALEAFDELRQWYENPARVNRKRRG